MVKNIKLYLIRHGQTERNANHDLIGQSPDEPLNDLGKKQAENLGVLLNYEFGYFDHIYLSPYKRAQDTFHLADKQLWHEGSISIDDRLREINQGDAIGKSRKKYVTPKILSQMEELKGDFKFPNGESLNEVEARGVSWLNDLLQDPTKENSSIAVFTHGMTIKTLIRHLMGIDHSFTWRIDIDNTSITKFSLVDGRWFCNYINDAKHIKD